MTLQSCWCPQCQSLCLCNEVSGRKFDIPAPFLTLSTAQQVHVTFFVCRCGPRAALLRQSCTMTQPHWSLQHLLCAHSSFVVIALLIQSVLSPASSVNLQLSCITSVGPVTVFEKGIHFSKSSSFFCKLKSHAAVLSSGSFPASHHCSSPFCLARRSLSG